MMERLWATWTVRSIYLVIHIRMKNDGWKKNYFYKDAWLRWFLLLKHEIIFFKQFKSRFHNFIKDFYITDLDHLARLVSRHLSPWSHRLFPCMTAVDSLGEYVLLFVSVLHRCKSDRQFGSIWITYRCTFRGRCVDDLNYTLFYVVAKILFVCSVAVRCRILGCCSHFPARSVSNFPVFRSCNHVVGGQSKLVDFFISVC